MAYTLIVFILGGFGSIVDQRAIVVTPDKQACEEARSVLLSAGTYLPDYVKCVPGAAPSTGPRP